MKKLALVLGAGLAVALGSAASAQQADPGGFNSQMVYFTAWDGSHFQVLKTLKAAEAAVSDDQGNVLRQALPAIIETDQAASMTALNAYVVLHPKPAPTGQ